MRIKTNRPAMGLMGPPRAPAPLKAGAHMPVSVKSGFDDRKGYQGSTDRRMGKISTPLLAPKMAKGGNGKGSPLNGKAVAPVAKKSAFGRGGPGVIKGKGNDASISHAQFEKLGAA